MTCTSVLTAYTLYSEVMPYTTDSTDLHITCPTCVADLLAKCHVCVECDSKYFDIVVLYSAGVNLYKHLAICVVFCRDDYEFRLILINLQRTGCSSSLIYLSWMGVITSCTAVVLFAHFRYIWVSSA